MSSPEINALLDEIGKKFSTKHGIIEMSIASPWQTSVEIALEDIHVPSIHRETFHKLRIKLMQCEQYGNDSVAYYKIGNEHVLRRLKFFSKYFKYSNPEAYFHAFIYPHHFLSSVGGFTFSLQRIIPGDEGHKFESHLYTGQLNDGAPDLSYFFDQALEFNRKVFTEDKEAVERIKVYDPNGPLCEDERRIKWFREAQREKAL